MAHLRDGPKSMIVKGHTSNGHRVLAQSPSDCPGTISDLKSGIRSLYCISSASSPQACGGGKDARNELDVSAPRDRWLPQSVHALSGTQVSELPVSMIMTNDWGGVPIWISAT